MGIVGVLFGAKLGHRGLHASIFVIRCFFWGVFLSLQVPTLWKYNATLMQYSFKMKRSHNKCSLHSVKWFFHCAQAASVAALQWQIRSTQIQIKANRLQKLCEPVLAQKKAHSAETEGCNSQLFVLFINLVFILSNYPFIHLIFDQ